MDNKKEKDIQRRVDKALEAVDTTKSVIIRSGATDEVTSCLNMFFGGKPVLLIADTNTYPAAGELVMKHLGEFQYKALDPFIFNSKGLYAEISFVEKLEKYLSGKDVVPIAVGSGTINDLTKLAAERCGLPYMSFATAGSMDGYTAFGASISYKGAKQTFDCKAPLAVIADVNIISKAPPEMNAAGYADLIAKVPSGADWIVADALGIEPIDKLAWDLTQTHLHEMVNNPVGVKNGDRNTMLDLMEGLIMTGLGMQVNKTSRPASGAEHQFSHLWDNQHHKFNGEAPFHGFKVGIGTIASEALYERILQLGVDHVDTNVEQIQKWWPQFNQIEKEIWKHFPEEELVSQTIEHCKVKYITAEILSKRLNLLKSVWNKLEEKLRAQLLGAQKIQLMIADAGAPYLPEQIGIERPRLKKSYKLAQLIRQRYTVLDLVLETGHWQKCVGQLFKGNGFWN